MYTIIPTFILAAIFAATVWGCGEEPSQPQTASDAVSRSPRQPLNKVQLEKPPERTEESHLTSAATPEAPTSVLTAPTPESGEDIARRGDLAVQRLAISRGIKNREPIDAGRLFASKNEKIFGFVEMSNGGESEQSVFVSFHHESGHTAGHVELSIPAHSPRWRTWAYSRNVQRPGLWTLVLEDEVGGVLDSVDFEVAETSEGF